MNKKEILQKIALSPELLLRAAKGAHKKSIEYLNNSTKYNMGSFEGIKDSLNSIKKSNQSRRFLDALRKKV